MNSICWNQRFKLVHNRDDHEKYYPFAEPDKCVLCYGKWKAKASFLRWPVYCTEYKDDAVSRVAMDDQKPCPPESQTYVGTVDSSYILVKEQFIAPN